MKNKIGIKIFSYIMILILAMAGVFTLSFKSQLENYMLKEIRSDVDKTSVYVGEQLNRINNIDVANKRMKNLVMNVGLNNISTLGRTLEARVYIFDVSDTLIFPTEQRKNEQDIKVNITLKNLSNRLEKEDSRKTVYTIDEIKNKKSDEKLGTVVIFADSSEISIVTKDLQNRVLMSLLVAVVIALILAMYLQRIIGKPIVNLRNEMNGFHLNRESIPVVKTNDEIEELYIAFNNLGGKLRGYNERQKVFFQNSSHELKSPLMSIQGYAEAIKDGIVTGDEVNESLDIIISESQRLKTTVDEIIYMSKVEEEMDDIRKVDFDLAFSLGEVVQELKAQSQEIKIYLDFNSEEEIVFHGDERQIKRAVRNIVNNSMRYAKTRIDVNVNLSPAYIYIDIIDDGNGFKIGEEELVFDRFYKGEKGHSGIGLSMVKTIIEKHDSEITAINNINFGALFKIKLKR